MTRALLLLLWALPAWSGVVVPRVKLSVPSVQVTLAGESHRMLGSVRALASSLPDMKAAGITTVGIEGLKLPYQAAVDNYVLGDTNLPKEALQFSPARVDAFAGLFEKAKETGVRLLAMGQPLEHWGGMVEPGGNLGVQMQQVSEGYKPGFSEKVAQVALTKRNQFMAQRLKQELGPNDKAVILVGHAHIARPPPLDYPIMHMDVSRYGTLHSELQRLGIKPYSMTLLGGAFVTTQDARDHFNMLRFAYELEDDSELAEDAGIQNVSLLGLLGTRSAARTR